MHNFTFIYILNNICQSVDHETRLSLRKSVGLRKLYTFNRVNGVIKFVSSANF